ncbi:MAG: hypothetical protein OEZ68_10095 [Gammaproteobacteria bacterium]|nr:hypothetical protein [Gammaproteobacteria bacterium]MDH5801140.1 hypothetical protein [Gammaproteobacteria bacterium]
MIRVKATSKTVWILAFTLLLSLPFSSQADNYLDELEKEAQRSATKSNAKLPPVKAEKLQEFTQLLKFERPATYKFFRKLSLENKSQVLATYGEDKKLSAASKKIFDLYFGQK